MILRTLILLLFTLLFTFPVFAASNQKAVEIGFLPTAPTEILLDNGLNVKFTSVSLGEGGGAEKNPPYYTKTYKGLINYTCKLTAEGINIEFKNTTNQVLVVKWAESAISVGKFSGIPFLEGMKYRDAGNPSATPDTIIMQGQTVKKGIYISRVKFDHNNNWSVEGESVWKDNSLKFSLALKVLDASNNAKYYSVITPSIGAKEEQSPAPSVSR